MTPPLPHQNPPPIPTESAQPSTVDMAQLVAILAGMENRMNAKMDTNAQETRQIKNNMGGNTRKMEKKMDGMEQTMREEMQCMGAGLQNGLEEI